MPEHHDHDQAQDEKLGIVDFPTSCIPQSQAGIARAMLGDLLLLEHKPNEALVEYRTARKLSLNRLNGLLSAGSLAEQACKPEEARTYCKAAALQTNNGATNTRPELARAVQFASTSYAAQSPAITR
jgi:hypothetical protein